MAPRTKCFTPRRCPSCLVFPWKFSSATGIITSCNPGGSEAGCARGHRISYIFCVEKPDSLARVVRLLFRRVSFGVAVAAVRQSEFTVVGNRGLQPVAFALVGRLHVGDALLAGIVFRVGR